jgi:group I intron endonuclease
VDPGSGDKVIIKNFMQNNNNSIFNNGSLVIVYNNAETDKKKILSDNKGKTGIYLWTHIESGKRYVGSAFNLADRLGRYYSKNYIEKAKENSYIYNAMLIHGYSAFSLTILEFIDISNLSLEESKKLILEREQKYLDIIFSLDEPNSYNILKVAGSLLGYKHSELTKALISKIHKGKITSPETIAKISIANTGKSHSTETIAKLSGVNNHMYGKKGALSPMFEKSGALNPFYGRTHSPETIAKLSEAKGGGTIYVYDTQGSLFKTFCSTRTAAEFFSCSHVTIAKYVKNNKLFQDKWKLSKSAAPQNGA